MADRGWKRPFDDEDAGNYIMKLPKAEHEARGMASNDGSFDPGRGVGRTNNVRTDRRHASFKSPRRTRVQPRSQGSPLATAQIGARSMMVNFIPAADKAPPLVSLSVTKN